MTELQINTALDRLIFNVLMQHMEGILKNMPHNQSREEKRRYNLLVNFVRSYIKEMEKKLDGFELDSIDDITNVYHEVYEIATRDIKNQLKGVVDDNENRYAKR